MGTLALTRVTTGTVISSTTENANQAAIEAQVNGNLQSTNLKDEALLNATKHGNLSSSTATMHSGTSILLADSGGKFTTDNVEAATQEIATYVGLGTSGLIGQYIVGQAMDNSTTFPTGNPTASVTVAANTAPYGIMVMIYATIFHDATAAGEDLAIPLNITNTGANPGDLSAIGSRNYRFECYAGFDGAAGVRTVSPMFYLTTGDSWESTIANTVKIGTPFRSGTHMTATNFGIVVWGLKG